MKLTAGLPPVPLMVMKLLPAVTLETAPGKAWPAAKVISPLPLMERPVSAGAAPPPNSRFSFPDGVAVLLPAGSACQRKVWFCAAFTAGALLNTEARKSCMWELKPLAAVAMPVAGNRRPAAGVKVPPNDPAPVKLAVLPLRLPVNVAPV